jgi:hypothetical protein
MYGAEIRALLVQPWVDNVLAKGRRSKDSKTQGLAKWATENVKKLK